MYAVPRRSRRRSRALAAAVLMSWAAGCGNETTAPVTELDIRGVVRVDGALAAGARVQLMDRRTSVEPGVVLASAVTGADGRYQLRARAARDGYAPGCEFLTFVVADFEFRTTASEPIRCVNEAQTIDLTVQRAF